MDDSFNIFYNIYNIDLKAIINSRGESEKIPELYLIERGFIIYEKWFVKGIVFRIFSMSRTLLSDNKLFAILV